MKKKSNKVNFLSDIIIIAAGIILMALFYSYHFLLTIIFFVGLVLLLKFNYRKHDIHFFLVALIVGSIGEVILVSVGIWEYAFPYFLGVPLWLPVAWGFIVLMMKRVAEDVTNFS